MTLPASGPISISQLRGEFGGAIPDSLSEYYRGGALVPNTGQNINVPTSGLIRLSNFYGAALAADFTTTMTRGTDGAKAPSTGYLSGSFGSLAVATFFRSTSMLECYTVGSLLHVSFAGTLPQNFFDHIICSLGTFNQSAVFSFGAGGGGTEWLWSVGGAFAASGTEIITVNG